jgi:hypothetical protein
MVELYRIGTVASFCGKDVGSRVIYRFDISALSVWSAYRGATFPFRH